MKAQVQNTEKPRLTPIENPSSIKAKLAYWFTKRKTGKVITPLKVHYSRFPEGLSLAKELMNIQEKCTLDNRLKHLIKVYVATLNGCSFCVDIGKATAQQDDIETEVFEDLLNFKESNRFTKSEKAALTYIDETTRELEVTDQTFENLQRYFNEREIVQITLLNAVENFYNLMNKPLNIGSDELCKTLNV
ncbi:carboxymuconolactone decarboxylase family protein [Fodinibius halophilus]|uniref:Carboxymuconolactone decarboxylase family protein n=1 Tax=Fodinibius halophilus TaxID=1736908 RepID=A0A6M1SU89_9BACT|nr:carboxymuconolactone decarboxylase family protein [Fodinibius halophilus]NGP87076.1 carboxymuconolactone decarboxylase family protein [Fodinibius halophilus]